MKKKPKSVVFRVLCLWLSAMMMAPPVAWAQAVKPASALIGEPEQLLELHWSDAPLQVVLDHYAELTGRTLIASPGIPAVLISLKSQEKLTESEFMVAIESVLRMNNIALVPMGDKFLKVIPTAELGTHGEQIEMGKPTAAAGRDADVLERRIVELKHVELAEIQPVIDQLKHASAKIQPLERANSFMIFDTKLNLDRIMEIIDFLDKPVDIKVETRIYELQHAEAAEVSSRLSELIQESQSTRRTTTSTRGAPASQGGVVRAGTTAARAAAARQAPTQQSAMDLAQRGIIQGEVKIVADERTNILIIISEPANYAFFDQIVTVLDKPVDPEIAVEVFPLEYADAEEISGILNDFVGAATQESSRSGTGSSARSNTSSRDDADARSTALRDFIARRQTSTSAASKTNPATVPGIGQLSESTRILADTRTNSILLMGRRSDIDALRRVVDDLDVMLAQVMIEAVILEVQLTDNVETGFDWLQRSFQAYNEEKLGPGGGYTVREPVVGFGGAQQFSGTPFIDGGSVTRETEFTTGALTYFSTFYDLNVDVIIQLAATSSDARILSTPVVVTTDNTEARIIVGESRPVVTSTSTTVGGVGRNTFQYQDIGIELTVTPRINPQKFVVMEIVQTVDNVGGFQVIDGNNVPVITRREMEAQIAVENRSSIVLGGLIANEQRKGRTKIPILGDIPLLGTFFRSDTKDENRGELLVLITPYVMATPEESLAESKRLGQRSVVTSENAWAKTWSDSPLVRANAPEEERAPQPLLDRIRGTDEREALPPASMLPTPVEPAQSGDPEVIMRPAPTVEYRVIPDPAAAPGIATPSPRSKSDSVSSLRSGIEDPRAALESPQGASVAREPAETREAESVPASPPAKKRGLFSRIFGGSSDESKVVAEPPPMEAVVPAEESAIEAGPGVTEPVAVDSAPVPLGETPETRGSPPLVEPSTRAPMEAVEDISAVRTRVDEDALSVRPPAEEVRAEREPEEWQPIPGAPITDPVPEAEPGEPLVLEPPRRAIDALRIPAPADPAAGRTGVESPRETIEEALPDREAVRPVPAPAPVVSPAASDRTRRLAEELATVTASEDQDTLQYRAEEAIESPAESEEETSPMPTNMIRRTVIKQGPEPMEAAPPVSDTGSADDTDATPPLK